MLRELGSTMMLSVSPKNFDGYCKAMQVSTSVKVARHDNHALTYVWERQKLQVQRQPRGGLHCWYDFQCMDSQTAVGHFGFACHQTLRRQDSTHCQHYLPHIL